MVGLNRNLLADFSSDSKKVNIMDKLLDCGHSESAHSSITHGYGIDKDGKKHCYACCAERDKRNMRETGRACLYLVKAPEINAQAYAITNWPNSLRFPVGRVRIGRHNMAGKRYDAWFMFENETWHAVTYGDNTQIAHCRRVKS